MALGLDYAARRLPRPRAPESARTWLAIERWTRWTVVVFVIAARTQPLTLSHDIGLLGWMLSLLAGLTWVTVAALAVAFACEVPGAVRPKRLVTIAFTLAVLAAACFTDWVFRAAFFVSMPALAAAADDTAANGPTTRGQLCGFFWISETKRWPDGTPVLFLNYHNSGWAGFARHPSADPAEQEWVSSNNGQTWLTDHWQFADED
ncbi:MAG: hypothetical protein AAF743_04140 [Planctomycetota bacterium]